MSKHDEHFYRQFGMILGALVLFALLALITANRIGAVSFQKARLAPGEVARRTAPMGMMRYGEGGQMMAAAAPAPAPAAQAAAAPAGGDKIYQSTCIACHSTGAAGAPKVGDKAAWGPRVSQGLDALVSNATNGKGLMPPKGGNTALSAKELKSAVVYMLEQTGVSAD